MDAIERVTCFRFVPKESYHNDFVLFEPREGCFSHFGRIGEFLEQFFKIKMISGNEQILSLAKECFDDYVIIHELVRLLFKICLNVFYRCIPSERNMSINVLIETIM
jgi:hypothetical protein